MLVSVMVVQAGSNFAVLASETETELPTETTLESSVTQETVTKTKTWDFDDASQAEDFNFYTSGSSSFSIQDGQLVSDGANGDLKAILNQNIKNIKSISVDMYPGNTSHSKAFIGGIFVGASDITNTSHGNTLLFYGPTWYTSSGKATRAFLYGADYVDGELDTRVGSGDMTDFFPTNSREAINWKLDFGVHTVTVTISVISDPSRALQHTFTYEAEKLDGKIGLYSGNGVPFLKYDNLEVTYEEPIPQTFTTGLQFDGTGLESYAKTNAGLTEKPKTVEAWLKINTDATGRQAIISNYTESSIATNGTGTWGLYTDENGQLWWTERAEGTADVNKTLTSDCRTGEWMHVAIVRSTGVLYAYVNGELVYTHTDEDVGETTSLNNPLTIGYCTVGAGTLNGEIGDIRLWNVERTQVEIASDMYNTPSGTETGLMHHWDFDEQTGTTFEDNVADNDGTLIGATWQVYKTTKYNFETESQLSDFTVATSGTGSGASISNGQLYTTQSSINTAYETTVSVALNNKVKNIKSISLNMNGSGDRFMGGIQLKSSESTFKVVAGSYRTSTSNAHKCAVYINDVAQGEVSNFFTAQKTRNPVNLTLEFAEETVTVTYKRTDVADKIRTFTETFTIGDAEYEIGIISADSTMYFDDLKIKYEDTTSESPIVVYHNEGFLPSGNTMKSTKLCDESIYTVEAWVKVPKEIADSQAGTIVTSKYVQPYFEMKMDTNGKPMLVWSLDSSTSVSVGVDNVDLRNDKWTHVAFVTDLEADKVTCYINGEAVYTQENVSIEAEDIKAPTNVICNEPLYYIGEGFPGWIADVRLWDKPLTEAEVQDSMMTQYTLKKDGLLVNVPLKEAVEGVYQDLSGNENDFDLYTRTIEWLEDTSEPGDYSIVVIPDQQLLAHRNVTALNKTYQWIADNVEKENIQMVLNVGDLVDNCGNTTQWENARTAYNLLPNDLPFVAVPGNHDYDTNDGWDKGYGKREQLTLMNQYFPLSLFKQYSTYGGALSEEQGVEDTVANTYHTFEVFGNRYLIMALEYVPRDDAFEWANKVVEAHPEHQVIVLTHNNMDACANFNSAGERNWEEFVSKHENIIMAISGHTWSYDLLRRVDKGENGNEVVSMKIDAQELGSAYDLLAIMRFNEEGTECKVSYYSPSRDKCMNEASQFTLTLPAPTPDKTELNEAIAQAEALQQTDYVSTTWASLQTALTDAKAVQNDENATKADVAEVLEALNTAKTALVSVGDKTTLNSLITEVEALEKEDYVSTTWANLQTALSEAKEVQNNADAVQTEVDAAVKDLKDAKDALVYVGDKTILAKVIAEVEVLEKEDYVSTTWSALQTALAEAKTVQNNADAIQTEVDEALKNLKDAKDALVLVGDKTALNAAITEVEALTQADYVSTTWSALQTALAEAKAVQNNADAIQTEVDAALKNLKDAKDALMLVGDKTELNKLITEVDSLKKNDYTEATWTTLQTVLSEAKEVQSNADAVQTEVDAALQALKNAKDALELMADKTELEKFVAEVEELKKDDYTNATWIEFEAALQNAKTVLSNRNATQAETDVALKVLQETKAALVLKGMGEEDNSGTTTPNPDSDSGTATPNPDSNKETTAPDTSDHMSATMAMVMLVVSLGVLLAMYDKKRRMQG